MIDASKTIDVLKFKMYNEWLYSSHLVDEGDSQLHEQLTKDIVKTYVDPLNLPKDSVILDVGCGPGYFMDEMKERGYTNLTGITLSENDLAECKNKGHNVKAYDMSFLPQTDGFTDESVDFIFLRHALEHSPYPVISLIEYNRLLKQGKKIYIEMPTPNGQRRHEFNTNHYSVMGESQWVSLFLKTGFKIEQYNDLTFDIQYPNKEGETVNAVEKYFCIVLSKQRSLDIK